MKRPSGRHTRMSTEENVMVLVDHIMPADVFKNIPGRAHSAFPNIKHNPLDDLDADRLRDWMITRLKEFENKHFCKT